MTSLNRRDLFRVTGVAAGAGAAAVSTSPAAEALAGAPTLPQKDSAAGRVARKAELAERRLSYTWNSNFPTLPGIPLASVVPVDDLPTLE